jgi:hypothetical protein
MSSPAKMQTVGEATGSIKGVFQSTFSSLANSLSLPQLRDSFFQNIIYIIMVIIILIGILVYIQMVGTTSVNPLSLPPTKEVRKIEIQKVVEGFDMEQSGGLEDSSTNIDLVGGMGRLFNIGNGGDGDLYENNYDNMYHGQYDNMYSDNSDNSHILDELTELTTDIFHNDPPIRNKRNND